MKVVFYILIVFVASCASKKTTDVKVSESKIIPEWVTDQEKFCSKDVLCATGEGESFFFADLNAKKALASIFESRVKAKTEQTLSTFSDEITSAISTDVNIEVSEEIDQILEGVEISKRVRYQNLFFSLAILSKKRVISLLKERLDNIQDELRKLLADKKRSNFLKVQKLINDENAIIQKLIIVDGKTRKANSFNKWKQLDQTLPRLRLCVANIGPFKNVDKFMISLINSVGHKVVPGDDRCEYLVKIVTKSKEEFLKVEGFKKMSIQTFIEFLSRSGQTLGSLEYKEVETGRSYSAIELKILNNLRDSLVKDFHQLNIP